MPRPRLSGRPSLRSLREARSAATRSGWTRALKDALDRPLTTYYLLLGATALLLTIGLIMVLSASSVSSYRATGDSYTIVKRQVMWVALGIPCAFIASRVSVRWVRGLAYPAFSISLILLGLTALVGVEVNGNTNWLALGPVQIQPSEIAKLSLVIWASHIYANKERRLGNLHQMLVPVVPGMILATGLVVIGRDLGTALIFFALLVAMLWVVGAPGRLFVMAFLTVSVLALALAATNPVRMARISSFTDPFRDYHSTGWQPAHGLYAMSSGGIFGEGIGASQQKWGALPEAHTDFIFAVLGEELGLVGTLLVIGLFLVIAYAGLRVARETTQPFVRYCTFGIMVWLIGQMMVNVGMVLAMLPVIGIPLPLVSYGGSSLLPTLAALGLVIGFARREPAAARALAQRRRARSAGLSARG
ncbi:putative lipid II flippase FtsW [Pimelobacter simplex]|uniref:Probable peptidoglycan glycosyltransferase FtsW n=1 Tax=Nocardioides simplex TaxID=2045 RepID=A0A0A1DR15_NOCSI|nr:putative lipid II flippase FtsW [Pimelobacter simplex]AIY19871.2 Cell division protein FtsW [Pimelobacter simplex]GEB13208.1 cell division protein FtsW [Pimelobacter simplex]SFM48079.1 cell division-specific peptidoglycan biosynthesis regulator FtsW [Pimelobacter simplex]